MLLTTKIIIATCRGRIKALVMVIRSKNRHIEILVNVSVAKVFSLSKSVFESLVSRTFFLLPEAILRMRISKILEIGVGSSSTRVGQTPTKPLRPLMTSQLDVQAGIVLFSSWL